MKISGEVEEKVVAHTLEQLSSSEVLADSDYVIMIYGQGVRSRAFYQKLQSDPDVDVLWNDWRGPKWLAFLSFISAQAGLVRLNNLKKLKTVFQSVGELTVCSLMIVRESKAQDINEAIKTSSRIIDAEKFFGEQDDYLYYEVNDDYGYEGHEDIVYQVLSYGSAFDKTILQGTGLVKD